MNAEQFPLLTAAVTVARTPYQRKSLSRVLEILNTYLGQDEIPNPEFIAAKEALNTVVEIANQSHEGLYSEAFSAAYHFPKVDNYKFDLGYMYGNQIAGKIKLATKKKFDNAEWFAVSTELVTIYNALMTLKDKIVKRKGRSEEEKADDYVPPMPTTVAALKVLEILKAMTDELTLQYENILFNAYDTSVVTRINNPKKRGDRYMPTHADILLQQVGADWDSVNGNYRSLVPNFQAILRTEAQKDASYAQRMFLYKNVTKLAMIIEKKGNFAAFKIIDGRVNSLGFQGEIRFYFGDGSEFTVRNKVIVNVSVHGRAFNQFPTTFHNVVLPNKTVLNGQQSQEEMIENFAGAL